MQLFQKLRLLRIQNLKAVLRRNYATIHENKTYKLCAVPALMDNYMYILINQMTQLAIAVDPVEPERVLEELEQQKAQLNAVLTTHHHQDHCGGNSYLNEKLAIPIYGGDERIESLTHKIRNGERMKINSFDIECLFTPCHTSGHMCYYVQTNTEPPVCFTGDTLFIAGCGRFFEGTSKDMHQSLTTLSKLPLSTLVCCGHEYSVNNLKFAVHVEPSNTKAREKLSTCLKLRDDGEPTVPSTIGDELNHNPFMRVHENEVCAFTKETEPIKVMAELRKAKDNFKV